ncbi:DNA polymerase III, delta subunit [Oceanospirillum multiglobuliferum]|uniref:DNA polymerase III subunit delta n=1 Tax=Oceanospirillum multiglobuliferum TaxID=64969 RepID=A0A1T4LHE2_9GAMM|nr:DNA polymerase III subunit delta [Oceanospirillum multiglobuliferum]OPX56660.1 DNA polymerase III subunit delta [Oceanospirillum multiglobuliferum]SJZ54135.1 DNA polymerase III, delta subunit [Oceanospirillum multiglobuliferum]
MKIFADKLSDHLKGKLKPIFFVSGDEPLQMREACDQIRAAVRKMGAEEREVYQVDNSFNWGVLHDASASMSLFASHKLIELHLPSGKPGQEGSQALQAYAKQISDDKGHSDNTLLIISGKLESSAANSKWFKALDAVGIYLPIWPIDASRLNGWISHRLRQAGFHATPEAISLLASRVEGNLLACDQEIQKLRLIYPEQNQLDENAILNAVQDSARFDVFALTDAMLLGDAVRTSKILTGLKGEGIEPPIILWGITRELRQLITLKHRVDQGQSFERLCKDLRIWDKRKPIYQRAMQQHSLRELQQLILQAEQVDRRIKGLDSKALKNSVWPLLSQLCLSFSGLEPIKKTR